MEKKLTITICGGGSLGHVTAGVLGSRNDCRVNILTTRPEKWQKTVSVKDPENRIFTGKIEIITKDAAETIPQSDIVYLCVPGYLIEETLKKIAPYLSENTFTGACVSSSGFFFSAEKVLPKNTKLFGFQRVPYISRVVEYGRSASLLGYKSCLNLAVERATAEEKEKFRLLMSDLLNTAIELLPNHFDASLTNSNPILHPSRLYGMWHDWKPGIVYPTHTLFYEDWDEFSAEVLISCDKEFFRVISHYPCTPGALPTLLDYYESTNAAELAAKMRSIPAFQKILAPMIKVEDGYLPDWGNRYFEEDFPYGLQIIKDLAVKVNETTPMIDKVLNWAKNMPIPSYTKQKQ